MVTIMMITISLIIMVTIMMMIISLIITVTVTVTVKVTIIIVIAITRANGRRVDEEVNHNSIFGGIKTFLQDAYFHCLINLFPQKAV